MAVNFHLQQLMTLKISELFCVFPCSSIQHDHYVKHVWVHKKITYHYLYAIYYIDNEYI